MIRRLGAAVTLAAVALASTAAQPPAPRRLVAIGDVHGAAAPFTTILQAAKLADGAGAWTGGSAILVQTGDYMDRGADVRRVLDMLRGLESAAPRAGGQVHVLLGNHEAMNLMGEYRDVNPAVYQAFADTGSEARRERAFADYRKLSERRTRDLQGRHPVYDRDRAAWLAAHPAGFLEYAEALSPKGAYGRWLRERAVVVNVDGTILMHAGLDPATAPRTLDQVNENVRDDIRKLDAAREHMAARGLILPFFTLAETIAAAQAEAEAIKADKLPPPDQRHADMLNIVLAISSSTLVAAEGPLWFRGFATWPDEEGSRAIDQLLQRYGATRIVAGHSVQNNASITPRFDRRLFLIDTGMLAAAYRGRPSALEMIGPRITALYPDGSAVLADGDVAKSGPR